MAAPTVTVTIDLSTMLGVAAEGVVITASLNKTEVYDGFIIAGTATATTDENGVATIDLFPNAPADADPAGLGTTGSEYRFQATATGGKKLDVRALVPNQDCDLHSILLAEDEEAAAGQMAGSIRYDVAQSLTSPQQAQARSNMGFDAAVRAVALTGLSLATATAIAATDTVLVAVGKAQAQITALDAAKANLSGAAFSGAVSATSFAGPLTGDVTGNVSGNAGTVTNGVYTSGSYADPSWITSLAGSKVSGNIAGNAATATALATARAINGVNFDGTAAITVTAAAGTLTGTTLNSSVVSASLNDITPAGGNFGVSGNISSSGSIVNDNFGLSHNSANFGYWFGVAGVRVSGVYTADGTQVRMRASSQDIFELTATGINLTGAMNISKAAGGQGLGMDASAGTADTGMDIRWLRGGVLKWQLGSGYATGGDNLDFYDRGGGDRLVWQAVPNGAFNIMVPTNVVEDLTVSGGGDFLVTSGSITAGTRFNLPPYTVATLPAAGAAAGLIFVSDESGGAVPAFSDGTNWRRVTDRAIVS